MKKILSLLTAAVLSASSVSSMTAFTTKTKQNLKSNKYLKQKFINTESIKLIKKDYDVKEGVLVNFTVNLRISLTKWNINWSGEKGWSHFFARMYSHIGIYHPELGQEAGKQTISWRSDSGVHTRTGYIFDEQALDTGNNVLYTYSIFASDYWAWSSNKYDFMGDIDLDSHNFKNGKKGYHGTYVDGIEQRAKALATDDSLLTFNVTFNLSSDAYDRSNQVITF